ncbi:MAG: hypothetical protein KF690_01100 [Bacteroidetes bacterium]|nr:hypothetical protein [Bacteroidota bacterium]
MTPPYKHLSSRKEMTQRRNEKIFVRFRELYEKDRLRMDEVLRRLSEEYHLATLTLERIIHKEMLSCARS